MSDFHRSMRKRAEERAETLEKKLAALRAENEKCITVVGEYGRQVGELRALLTEAREAMQHTLAMGHLTPNGSQEGWYNRVLQTLDAALLSTSPAGEQGEK